MFGQDTSLGPLMPQDGSLTAMQGGPPRKPSEKTNQSDFLLGYDNTPQQPAAPTLGDVFVSSLKDPQTLPYCGFKPFLSFIKLQCLEDPLPVLLVPVTMYVLLRTIPHSFHAMMSGVCPTQIGTITSTAGRVLGGLSVILALWLIFCVFMKFVLYRMCLHFRMGMKTYQEALQLRFSMLGIDRQGMMFSVLPFVAHVAAFIAPADKTAAPIIISVAELVCYQSSEGIPTLVSGCTQCSHIWLWIAALPLTYVCLNKVIKDDKQEASLDVMQRSQAVRTKGGTLSLG